MDSASLLNSMTSLVTGPSSSFEQGNRIFYPPTLIQSTSPPPRPPKVAESELCFFQTLIFQREHFSHVFILVSHNPVATCFLSGYVAREEFMDC